MDAILMKLYDIAEKLNINIDFLKQHIKGFIVNYEEEVYISLSDALTGDIELRDIIAEELGHCACNAFYELVDEYLNPRLAQSNISKAEHKAKEWKYMQIIEIDSLINSLKSNQGDLYAVCEDFNVSLKEINYAIEMYTKKGLLPLNQSELFEDDY